MEIAGSTPIKRARILASFTGSGGFDAEDPGALRAYCERLARLLGSRPAFHQPAVAEATAEVMAQAQGGDLVLLFDPGLPALLEVFFSPAGTAASGGGPATVVIVRRLSWPPQEILLPLRVRALEAQAVFWAGRLAELFAARLTVLPLIPFQPGDYQWGSRQQDGIESVLAPSRPSGELFRALLAPISQRPISSTLRLRQGDPTEQVSLEIARGHYDLIVIGRPKAGEVGR